MEELDEIIKQINEEFGEGTITTADKIDPPENPYRDFMDRNPMAGGGMLVQPSADGSRPGYAKIKETKAMNYGNIKKKEDSIQSYIDNFGEDLLNKMSKTKYKKNFKNLTGDNLKNFKRRVTKFKDFISENKRMPNETEAREIGRAPRTLKEADIQIKLLNATNKTNFFDPKKFIKDNNITMSQLRTEAKKLQRNIYKKRMILSGKEDVRAKLKWLPNDPTFSDNALNKLWKSNLIKYEREKIDELFYDAFGREFVKGTKDKNPTYNPKKFLAIKNNLNEYRQLRDAIQLKYPNIRFELDHPLSKSTLNKIFNATTDQLTRVNILEADLNNGFKDSLSLQYEKAVQSNNLNKKKAVEKIARDLKLNIGKISDDATNFKYGVKEFQKLDIKKELINAVKNQANLSSNFKTYVKNNPNLFKEAGVNPNVNLTKITKSEVKGIEKLILNFASTVTNKCSIGNADGGRIGLKLGSDDCLKIGKEALDNGLLKGFKNKQQVNLAETILKAGGGLKSALSLRGLFGPAAIAATVAFEGGLIGYDMLTSGKTLREAFGDNLLNYALGEKTKIDPQEEMFKRFKGLGYSDQEIGSIKKGLDAMNTINTGIGLAREVGEQTEALQKSRGQSEEFMIPDDQMMADSAGQRAEQNLKDAQEKLMAFNQNLKAVDRPGGMKKEDVLNEYFSSGKYAEDLDLFDRAQKAATVEQMQSEGPKFMGSVFPKFEEKRLGIISENSPFGGANPALFSPVQRAGGFTFGFAGGGIAKLAGVNQGPPPESGPNSQGLQGLFNRVKKV